MGPVYVVLLFVSFLALWEMKRRRMKRGSGVDPEVFGRATAPVQRYMSSLEKLLTLYVAAAIVAHLAGASYYSMFTYYTPLDRPFFDHIGFIMGLAGLGVCAYAQSLMGDSWRVGIDEKMRTELVTGGIYRFIRNPTYLGLDLLVCGVWIIWPTWTMAVFAILFFVFMDFQVRCEEDHLLRMHGDSYRAYLEATKRYLPYIY